MSKALVTGGSRGVGAATAIALAERDFDVAVTYREKRSRADKVTQTIRDLGKDAVAFGGDMTLLSQRQHLASQVHTWAPVLNALVLNASGGLERSILAERPDYAREINHDAQVGLVDEISPILGRGSTIAFITSHWAHRYGEVEQLPSYEPVAASKHLGETAMRERQDELAGHGIRLLVITGDLIDGTITAKLLERKAPGLADTRRDSTGELITTEDMGRAIADAITNPDLPSGHTVVVGAPLESLA